MIDTPGIMDTAPVTAMAKAKEKVKSVTGIFNEKQQEILRELARVFVLSPNGLNAVIITIRYGGKFGLEDAKALELLIEYFGIEALPYMILILTYGDEAVDHAKEEERSIEEHLEWYIKTLPGWVQQFVEKIGGRKMLFDNKLKPEEKPDDCQKQVCKLIQVRVHFEDKICRSRSCRSVVA